MKAERPGKGQGGGKKPRDRKYHERPWRPGGAEKQAGAAGAGICEDTKNTIKGRGKPSGPGRAGFMVGRRSGTTGGRTAEKDYRDRFMRKGGSKASKTRKRRENQAGDFSPPAPGAFSPSLGGHIIPTATPM